MWRDWLKIGHWARPRRKQRAHSTAATAGAVSAPEHANRWNGAPGTFVPLPNQAPFQMLEVYRCLRDGNPDISDAVWTWKRLCQTGFDVELVEPSSDDAERRARKLIDRLNERVNSGDRGMDGLLDIIYASLFTYGAAALEVVLGAGRGTIHDVVPIDAWTVRFKQENGRLLPCQLHEGREIMLPPERFIYLGLDRDGTNPYGRSMLASLPQVLQIQHQLILDMAKASRNAGYNKLHVQYAPGTPHPGETETSYQERIARELSILSDNVAGLETDRNLVTIDKVKIAMLQGGLKSRGFYDSHKAIEEQVITGVHLMPILLGRNYGTTETYGTAQFEILNRQVESVNRQIKRLLERLYNFELALMWGEAQARVHMRQNRTVDVLKAAQARALEVETALKLRAEGIVDNAQAETMLNL